MSIQVAVDDQVRLRTGGMPGFGGLNAAALAEHGYQGGEVPVVAVDGRYATVQLPDGYKLDVTARDLA